MICTAESPPLPLRVNFHILIFFLVSLTIIAKLHLGMYAVPYVRSIVVLTNSGFSKIHSHMYQVHMVPVYRVISEDFWHNNFITSTD